MYLFFFTFDKLKSKRKSINTSLPRQSILLHNIEKSLRNFLDWHFDIELF